MNTDSLKPFVKKYLEQYDDFAKDKIWHQNNIAFRKFWSDQILANTTNPISDADSDFIIRILDVNAKGYNSNEHEAVARTMVKQNEWYKLFSDLRIKKNLSELIDSIFKEKNLDRKADLIDRLFEENIRNKNKLTGKGAVVINTFLAAYDAVNNLTVVSLKHRKMQMDFLGIWFDWNNLSIGQQVVQTNTLLQRAARNLGINGTARTLSWFWYFDGKFTDFWKAENIQPTTRTEMDNNYDEDSDVPTPEQDADVKQRLKDSNTDREIEETLAGLEIKLSQSVPEIRERLARAISRNPKIARLIKKRANYECEICHLPGFRKRGGGLFAEAHHRLELGKEGKDVPSNLMCVCANCHRKLHYAEVVPE